MQVELFGPRPKVPRGKGWGGRRAGAGRKPTRPGKRIEHRTRPKHAAWKPVHATVRVVSGLPSLRERELAAAIGAGLRGLVDTDRARVFRLCQFSIQEDHIHMLVEAEDTSALSNGMKAINIRVAKAVNRVMGRKGRVIQDRYHQHKLTCPMETRNVLVYLLFNWKKHGAKKHELIGGLDNRSSVRWFDGLVGWTAWTTGSPVSPPITWLLRKGWKRYGRIRRHEGPAGV